MTDELTWEDVEAVCKLMGWGYRNDIAEFNDFTVEREGYFGATFTNPQEVLEYITSENLCYNDENQTITKGYAMSEVKPITWSFSSLKAYQTCARQFYSYKVAKQYVQEETEAIRYGKVLHEAFEFYIKENKELPPDFAKFRPVLEALKGINGTKYTEYEMALTKDLTPTEFLGKDVFCRGIADLLIVNGDTAYVVDYKSGSAKYPDKKQLELMALMVFAHFPEVQSVKGMLLFVHHNVTIKGEYKRTQEKEMWAKWLGNVEQLKTSHLTGSWSPNPSGLCRGWCMVEWCEHHQPKRK